MPEQKYKVKFSMKMTDKGAITSSLSKAPDKMASADDVEEFVKEAKIRLDDFLKRIKESEAESYGKG